ncbi:histidine phosphatase family protein [Wukongibacter baidiensis]|uniref:histidine phosphatase family protein n=1 Tax=Wukongibacter baidiensis TaxID=1723361 RepID=UPI003D7F55EF
MTKLYITRHGQTEWNLEGRMQGQMDSALTALGKQQAKWLGERLNDVELDIIISSSSGRAFRTAEVIRGDRDIEIIPNDNLREMHFGNWQGQLHTEIEESWPEEYKNLWSFPHLYSPIGGETVSQVLNRAGNEIEKIITKYEGKNVLIVAHAVVLKAIFTYLEDKELKDFWKGAFMHSTCLNIVEVKNDSRNIVLQGDISHYPVEEQAT